MQRVRRLAATAVIAALAIGGVAACRSEPDAAAYVGSTKITEKQVDAVMDDARARLDTAVADFREQQAAQPGASPSASPAEAVELPIRRQDVVTTLVGRDVLRAVARERDLQPVAITPEQAQQQVGLPAETEYVKAFVEFRGLLEAFARTVQPAQASEADLRDVYDRLRAGGGLAEAGTSFQDFVGSLSDQDRDTLAQNIGLRNALAEQVEKSDATVNPRYGRTELPLVSFNNQQGGSLPLVVLSFEADSRSPAVIDAA